MHRGGLELALVLLLVVYLRVPAHGLLTLPQLTAVDAVMLPLNLIDLSPVTHLLLTDTPSAPAHFVARTAFAHERCPSYTGSLDSVASI